jgi:hypothetical protein
MRLITERSTNQGHQDARAKVRHWAPPFRLVLNMIIVSESSAKATQPVGTGRYTLARRRSSAARNDTPRYVDTRRISVHT